MKFLSDDRTVDIYKDVCAKRRITLKKKTQMNLFRISNQAQDGEKLYELGDTVTSISSIS